MSQKFNQDEEVFYDGGEGDGDDKCYYALSDGNNGYYFVGTAFERINYSSGDDFWIIHANNDGTILSEQLFDQVPPDMYIIGGIILDNSSIALITDDYLYIVTEKETYGTYDINANNLLYIDTDSFFVSYSNSIYEYSYNGDILRSIKLSSYFDSISSLQFLDENTIIIGGSKGNAVENNSEDDAIIAKLDISQASPRLLNLIQIDAGHGDVDTITSMYLDTDTLFVSGTSYDLLSPWSETDGWIRIYDIDSMTENKLLYYESDNTIGNLFKFNETLMAWNKWEIGILDISDKTNLYTTGIDLTFRFSDTTPTITAEEFLIPGYVYEYDIDKSNGIDWVIKRVNLKNILI